MKLFDTHCHLDDEAFDPDRDEVIHKLPEQGIEKIIWAGTNLKTSLLAQQYAQKNGYIYFTCGCHPQDAVAFNESDLMPFLKMSKDPKCAAIGEIGLDYHYQPDTRIKQQKVFGLQLDLAAANNKPVVIHDREATQDILWMLSAYQGRLQGVLHCFSGSVETAKTVLKMGFYLSFTGVITFKNAKKAIEVLQYAPKDRILIETDSPYMSPEPFRGRRNDPSRVLQVAQKLAQIWETTAEEAAEKTNNNACRLFGIND